MKKKSFQMLNRNVIKKNVLVRIIGSALFALSFLHSFHSIAQTEKEIDSKIKQVSIFLDRAQITREIKTRIEAGKTNLVLTGLTTHLDHESIQVNGKGSIIILGISHRQNFLDEAQRPKKLQSLIDSLNRYSTQLTVEQNQKDILTKEEQLILSNQKIGGTQQNLTVAELKAMADFYRTRLSEIGLAKIKSDEKLKQLNERITRLNKQIAEQRGFYARNTTEIVISLSAETQTNAELEVNYIVADAGWYPVYDLRAVDTRHPIKLGYKANVFQNTGEDWNNVSLTLSTANPSLGGLKPELSTWYLDLYQPALVRTPKYRDARKSEAGLAVNDATSLDEDRVAEAESVAQYVSTIQTTLNTAFNISLPYNVPSGNKPTLVEVHNYEMKADYNYAVTPKLDQDAFLLAKATGWEEFNLLPGEANVFFEGTFVGKTFIDPNNIRDTLSVSLGRDKRIVVKREKLKDFTTRKTIGANLRDSYAYEISVRNTKGEPIKITLEDQIPVSQNSQIEISLTDAGSAQFSQPTGKLVWEFSLQPNETKKVQYKFEVRYPKDKVISGLN
ncbi:MAG TPA: DUF4139 domain-containing protein [Cyclobacteriaceae bacterium]|nr:DUF4139 domain-containing protein [Cyclobacteriaceae bacterium]